MAQNLLCDQLWALNLAVRLPFLNHDFDAHPLDISGGKLLDRGRIHLGQLVVVQRMLDNLIYLSELVDCFYCQVREVSFFPSIISLGAGVFISHLE